MGCPVTATGKLPCFAGWGLNSASPPVPAAVVVPMAKRTLLLEMLEEPRTVWTVGAVMGQDWGVTAGVGSLAFAGHHWGQAAAEPGRAAFGHGASVSACAVSPLSAP